VSPGTELTWFCLWAKYKIGFRVAAHSVPLCLQSDDARGEVCRPVYFDWEAVTQREIYCLAVILWTATVITGAIWFLDVNARRFTMQADSENNLTAWNVGICNVGISAGPTSLPHYSIITTLNRNRSHRKPTLPNTSYLASGVKFKQNCISKRPPVNKWWTIQNKNYLCLIILKFVRFEAFTAVAEEWSLGISSQRASVASCSLFCHPDEGGARFFRNIGSYKSHTA
jgi:hypothetical protein